MTEVEITKEFDTKLRNAFEEAAKAALKEVQDKAGGGEIAQTYHYRVTSTGFEIFSDDPRAVYLEYGTGITGEKEFKQYADEKKPVFAIPIKPVEKKVLHWKKDGKEVFAHSTKGISPKAPLRETLLGNQEVIKKAFSDVFK